MRVAPPHYLRKNHAEWTPATVIVFDTETYVIPDTEPQVLALRCWDARLVDRRPTRGGKQQTLDGTGETVADLIAWMDRTLVGRETVWVCGHNLGFDLTVTRLPLALADDGWTITQAAMATRSPWMQLAKGRKHLTLADLWSWLPIPLADIGTMLGIPKPDLPDDDDSLAAWHHRCRGDVDITARAVLELMGWWDRHALGRWTFTGPSSGWNAMRHIPATEPIVIDPEPDKVQAERKAFYGGRRQVWRTGTFTDGPFLEVDFEAAYPTVAKHLPLPVQRSHTFDSLPLDDFRLTCERWGVIAKVEVETDTPRWPVRTPSGVLYPVGRFTTTLAGPDVAEALRLGCLRSVGAGVAYRLGYALANWADWVLAVQHGETSDASPLIRHVAKSWGRTVIGKWGAAGVETSIIGPATHAGWHTEDAWDHETGQPGQVLDLAGVKYLTVRGVTGDNCFPAIPAFVEAYVRVRLGRAVEALGAGVALQCDTDGLIIDARRLRPVRAATGRRAGVRASGRHLAQQAVDGVADVVAPLRLRIKREHKDLTILGPQHMIVSGKRSFSGLRADAKPMGDGRYVVRLWPGMRWQMSNGDPRGFARPQITPKVVGPFPTGWLTEDGHVHPPHATIGPGGDTVMLAWSATPGHDRHPPLHPVQHPELALAETGWHIDQWTDGGDE